MTFDNNGIIPGQVTVDTTNVPLYLTNCGQHHSIALSHSNVAAGSGALTAASGTMNVLRQGKTISVNVDFTITTNGTGATDLRFALPHGTPFMDSFGIGEEHGVSNTSVFVRAVNASPMLQLRKMDAGFTYPGGDGRAFTFSINYAIA